MLEGLRNSSAGELVDVFISFESSVIAQPGLQPSGASEASLDQLAIQAAVGNVSLDPHAWIGPTIGFRQMVSKSGRQREGTDSDLFSLRCVEQCTTLSRVFGLVV